MFSLVATLLVALFSDESCATLRPQRHAAAIKERASPPLAAILSGFLAFYGSGIIAACAAFTWLTGPKTDNHLFSFFENKN